MVGEAAASGVEESLRIVSELGGSVEEVEGQLRCGSDPEFALQELEEIGEGIEEVVFRLREDARREPAAAREAEDLYERFGRVEEEARLKVKEAAADPLRGR